MAIQDQFKSILGRDANPDELAFFGKFVAENNLQPYEIGQILQSTPEYQQTLLQKQGEQYQQLLGASDQAIMDRTASTLEGQFRRLGRAGTSGFAGALGTAGRDLAMQRQSQLADFYGQRLPQLASLYQGYGQAAQQRGYGERDLLRQRGWDVQDYERQQRDYMGAMREQNSSNLRNALYGGLLSGGLGAIGTIGGAMAGRKR